MPSLQAALDTFLQVDRSPFTNRNYHRVLTHLVIAIGPSRDVKHVTYEELSEYFYPLVRERGIKPNTARNYALMFKSFFNWCVKRRYITFSPAADLAVRVADDEPRPNWYVPPAELSAMVSLASHDVQKLAILLFFADSGCRVGGIASLTIDNLDLKKMTAKIREKGGRWQEVSFGELTAEVLEDWLAIRPETEHRYVFIKSKAHGYRAKTTDNFRYLVKQLAKGIGAPRKYPPHALRHSVGRAWDDRGVSASYIMRKMGHRSLKATQIYVSREAGAVAALSRELSLAALREPPKPEEPTKLSITRRRRSG